MGMDFVALLRYRRTREVVRAINGLENQRWPLSAEVQSLWGEAGFFRFDWDRAYWVSRDDGRQVKRPAGADLRVALRTVDGFFLTFGRGVCCAYHLLRWRLFLTEPRWRRAMLGACNVIADLLGAEEGGVTSDFHPSYSAFLAGAGFDACLRAPTPQEAVADLYHPAPDGSWDSHGFWRFRSAEAITR